MYTNKLIALSLASVVVAASICHQAEAFHQNYNVDGNEIQFWTTEADTKWTPQLADVVSITNRIYIVAVRKFLDTVMEPNFNRLDVALAKEVNTLTKSLVAQTKNLRSDIKTKAWLSLVAEHIKLLKDRVLSKPVEIDDSRRREYETMKFTTQDLFYYVDTINDIVLNQAKPNWQIDANSIMINGITLEKVLFQFVELLHLMGLGHAVRGLSQAFSECADVLSK